MNPESKHALQQRLTKITLLVNNLNESLVKAEEELKIVKDRRDDMKTQIDRLNKEKQKIKEDINA